MSYNKTTTYLSPMLEYPIAELISNFGFLNCYLGDHSYPDNPKNSIFVRFRPPRIDDALRELIKEAESNPRHLRTYDLPHGEIMFIFELDQKFEKDIEMFKRGKFSKMSREYAESNFSKESKRYKVLVKDPEYKQSIVDKYRVNENAVEELDSIPEPEKEIFRFNDLLGWTTSATI